MCSSGLVGFFVALGILVVTALWVIFPVIVMNRFTKLQRASEEMNGSLAAMERELAKMNEQLATANKMHGDLNRAAQWFVDRSA